MSESIIHGLEIGVQEKRCVDIVPEAIQEEYVRLPADLAYWNARYARALKEFLTAKAGEKQMESMLSIKHRELIIDNGGKPTEKMVENAVNTDPKMIEARNLLVETEVEKARIWGLLDAVRSKKEMLISLGAHVRQEMEGDPMVRAAHADARRVRENNR